MGYRLKRSETVPEGIHRILREEIASAAAGLRKSGNTETAVHEARKSIKKTRALLRLMSPKLKGAFGESNIVLRNAGRHLTELRDAVVLVSTLDALKQRFPEDPRSKSLTPLRTALIRRRKKAEQAHAIARVTSEAAAALDQAADGAKDWPAIEAGFAGIARGLDATYREGRDALRYAQRHPTATSLHDLRKRVKDHWYHVRLLEDVWSDSMRAREKSLKETETWLGEDHNLAVLLEAAGKSPSEDLKSLIGDYQKELRASALSLAVRIYEEKPRAFLRNIRHLWDAWKNEPRKAMKAARKTPVKAAPAKDKNAAA
jgi:CHAD domain-containing protein